MSEVALLYVSLVRRNASFAERLKAFDHFIDRLASEPPSAALSWEVAFAHNQRFIAALTAPRVRIPVLWEVFRKFRTAVGHVRGRARGSAISIFVFTAIFFADQLARRRLVADAHKALAVAGRALLERGNQREIARLGRQIRASKERVAEGDRYVIFTGRPRPRLA